MTIYLPDALAAEVKAGLTETNISAVCQPRCAPNWTGRRQWRRPTLTATSG
jgi:hypothetical protein